MHFNWVHSLSLIFLSPTLCHFPGAFCVPLALNLVLPPEPESRHLLNHLCGHAKVPLTKSISLGHAVCGLGTSHRCCSPPPIFVSIPFKEHVPGETHPDEKFLSLTPQNARRLEFGSILKCSRSSLTPLPVGLFLGRF